jgi:hypothetical protein
MNIFAVSDCPIECAKALDNKRLVKMVLETAQLLCGAVVVCGGQAPYKLTHRNHPAAVWTRKSQGNYVWLIEHFKALGAEYTRPDVCLFDGQVKVCRNIGELCPLPLG